MKPFPSLAFLFLLFFSACSMAFAMSHAGKLAAIVEGFSHSDPAVQYEARRALASYVYDATAPDQVNGAEKVTRELLAYLTDAKTPREARKYMIRDLARVGTATAVEPLGRILTGKDFHLAESARQALQAIKGPEASRVLKQAIGKARNEDDRRDLIRTLANRAERENEDYFIEGLDSRDAVLAHESALALGLLGTRQAVDALTRAYASSTGEQKQLIENELLRQDGVSDTVLLKIFEQTAEPSNRQAALVRLVSSGHAHRERLLQSALQSGDARLRATAIHLALAHDQASPVRAELDRLSNSEWLIVLHELEAFPARDAEDLALTALEKEDAAVRAEALRALATHGTARSVDVLLENFDNRDKTLQQAATYAIARMPGNALNNRINQLLNSEDETEVLTGIALLAHRDVPNRSNRLHRFVNGDNPQWAREALRTLSTTADEEDLYRLLFLARRTKDEQKASLITGMLKKVASEIGSRELQSKVAAL